MKKNIFILISAFCLAAAAFGQQPGSYESFFGHDSTRWNGYAAISQKGYQNYVLRQNSDTVIDSVVYKKIELSKVYWKEGYSEVRDSAHDFFLREDTAYGRLWCRYPDENEEFLIADMSLRRDTITLHHFAGTDESKTFLVDYDIYDGSDRYHIQLSNTSARAEHIHFIEGVGCYNLLDYSRIPFWNKSAIMCVHKDGEHVFEHHTNYYYVAGDGDRDVTGYDQNSDSVGSSCKEDEDMFEQSSPRSYCICQDSSSYVKREQYITWTEDLHFDISQSYAILHATATSGLPIHYVCPSTKICRISGDTVFLLRTGRTTLYAGQDGNEEYERAHYEDYMRTLNVTDSTVSIAVVEKPVMRLYPNPTHSTVTIQGATEQIESVRIFDMAGRQVSAFGPAATFDISHLPAGSYIVRIQSADHPDQHLRLIKE